MKRPLGNFHERSIYDMNTTDEQLNNLKTSLHINPNATVDSEHPAGGKKICGKHVFQGMITY